MAFKVFKKKSIQKKLLLAFVPVFVVSFLVLSVVSYNISRRALSSGARETAVAISSRYAAQLKATMDSISGYLGILADTQVIREARDKEQIVTVLSDMFNRTGMFDVLFFVWPDGSAIRSVNTAFDASEREYFKKVSSTKTSYVSDVMISSSSGKPSVVVCEPVMNGGELAGMLGVTYNLERLDNLIKGIEFKKSGFGFIVDRTGLMVANPWLPDFIGKLNIGVKHVDPALNLGFTEVDGNLLAMFKKVSSGWNEAALGGYVFNGVKYDGVLAPIDLHGGQHWAVAVIAPLAEVNRDVKSLFRAMTAISAIFIAVALLCVVRISRKVAAPIALLRDECLVMAGGDLRGHPIRIRSDDEIGELAEGFAVMKRNLSGLIAKVKNEAVNLASASEELQIESQNCTQAAEDISRAMADISNRTEAQTDSTRNVFSTANDIYDITQNVLAATLDVNNIALNASKDASSGQAAVEKAMKQMKEIGDGSSAVQDAVVELAEGYHEISDIVNLISSIAKQTNLLALNAAIEAARAGEYGRGFAVVAEEVRNLAESSSSAAQKITSLISDNQNKMEQAVKTSKSAADGVSAGVESVNSAGEIFGGIASSIISLSDQINGVSSSIEKIALGNQNLTALIGSVKEVSEKNITDLNGVSASTEEQLASTEEIISACGRLAEMAAELREESAGFEI
jgi:methyl-accepting chemotaxis protein